jgi:hypothetical protein
MKKLPVEISYTFRTVKARTSIGTRPIVYVSKHEGGRQVEEYTVTFGQFNTPRCSCPHFTKRLDGCRGKTCKHGEMVLTHLLLTEDEVPQATVPLEVVTSAAVRRAQALAERQSLWG